METVTKMVDRSRCEAADDALVASLEGCEELLEGYPSVCASLKSGYFALAKARSSGSTGFLMSTNGVPGGVLEPRVRVECTT